MTIEITPADMFAEATNLLQADLVTEAIKKFHELAGEFPESELADDALFNAGLCYFHIGLYTTAIAAFNNVLMAYPDGDITTLDEREHGKTAAKCYYALVNCYLSMSDIAAACVQAEKLTGYHNSYILTALGEKVTYQQLAAYAIASYHQIIGGQ